jgi:hypothetical protein
MISADTPHEPRRPRRLLAGLSLVAALLAAAAVTVPGGGCGKAPGPAENKSTDPVAEEKKEPWKVAAGRLKRETDLAACKAALLGLRVDTGTGDQKLPALSDEALAALAAVVPLSDADRDEIRGGPFSDHDAAYLADCFYLRDAARSLALTGLPLDRRADLAFAWVCRQVYIHPWLRRLGPQSFASTALPPTAVLRRGFGSGLERMYVFLALLQQLELDGCLVGPPAPGPSTVTSLNTPVDTREALVALTASAPRGPFWAVGVRIGADVRLYDPWRGVPFPVTLNQLRSNPDAAKTWFEDKANASGATLEDAKKATVFLAVPVNSLSARMAAFESHLKGDLGAKVALDPKAVRAAFPDPKPAVWNPPQDAFAYGRTSRSYLPAELGGTDTRPGRERLFEQSRFDQLPPEVFKTPEALLDSPSAAERLRITAATGLGTFFVDPPNPRERIQRGQYQEAARDLVAKQEFFANGLERLRVNKDADQQIADWVTEAKRLYGEVNRANFNKDTEAEAVARQEVENHWKTAGAQFLIDRASADVGQAEASFLLALCKHEQAERLQTRLDRATGTEAERLKPDVAEAWKTALSLWRTYEQHASAHAGFPGRAEHGKALAARAAKLAEAVAKK